MQNAVFGDVPEYRVFFVGGVGFLVLWWRVLCGVERYGGVLCGVGLCVGECQKKIEQIVKNGKD